MCSYGSSALRAFFLHLHPLTDTQVTKCMRTVQWCSLKYIWLCFRLPCVKLIKQNRSYQIYCITFL
jgi:hypothetical protein